MEFFSAVVVDKDMKGEDIAKNLKRETLGDKGRHGRVVKGKNSDGLAVVDFIGEVGLGEVLVEGGEFRVFI